MQFLKYHHWYQLKKKYLNEFWLVLTSILQNFHFLIKQFSQYKQHNQKVVNKFINQYLYLNLHKNSKYQYYSKIILWVLTYCMASPYLFYLTINIHFYVISNQSFNMKQNNKNIICKLNNDLFMILINNNYNDLL